MTGHVIERLFAWVVEDPADDCEAVIAVQMPDGQWSLAIASDLVRIESLRRSVTEAGQRISRVVTLREYTTMRTIETIHPNLTVGDFYAETSTDEPL